MRDVDLRRLGKFYVMTLYSHCILARLISWSSGAIVKAPMDISLAVAQGFHNAPRLYGDETVRRPVRITGIHSGLVASRNEFFYGIYDGFTGVVTQPYHGAKERGVLGFVDGVGMGFGKRLLPCLGLRLLTA